MSREKADGADAKKQAKATEARTKPLAESGGAQMGAVRQNHRIAAARKIPGEGDEAATDAQQSENAPAQQGGPQMEPDRPNRRVGPARELPSKDKKKAPGKSKPTTNVPPKP